MTRNQILRRCVTPAKTNWRGGRGGTRQPVASVVASRCLWYSKLHSILRCSLRIAQIFNGPINSRNVSRNPESTSACSSIPFFSLLISFVDILRDSGFTDRDCAPRCLSFHRFHQWILANFLCDLRESTWWRDLWSLTNYAYETTFALALAGAPRANATRTSYFQNNPGSAANPAALHRER